VGDDVFVVGVDDSGEEVLAGDVAAGDVAGDLDLLLGVEAAPVDEINW